MVTVIYDGPVDTGDRTSIYVLPRDEEIGRTEEISFPLGEKVSGITQEISDQLVNTRGQKFTVLADTESQADTLSKDEEETDSTVGVLSDTEPYEGYGDQTVEEVVSYLASATESERSHVMEYEKAHKNRKGITEWSPEEGGE